MTTDAFTDAARAYAEQACYQDENIPIAEAGFRAGWKAALTHLTAHDARVRRDAALTLAEHFSAEAIDQARQGNPDGADFYRAVATEIENQIPEETP